MKREEVVKNIMSTYKGFGVTEKEIEEVIDSGIKNGLSYDVIYTGLRLTLGSVLGIDELFFPSEIAELFGVTVEEANRVINESVEELKNAGVDTESYFHEVDKSDKNILFFPSGLGCEPKKEAARTKEENFEFINYVNCEPDELTELEGAHITEVTFGGQDKEIINISAMNIRDGKEVSIEFEIHNGTVYRRVD